MSDRCLALSGDEQRVARGAHLGARETQRECVTVGVVERAPRSKLDLGAVCFRNPADRPAHHADNQSRVEKRGHESYAAEERQAAAPREGALAPGYPAPRE